MTALDLPCIHHEPSQTINTVVLWSYFKEISPLSVTTFPISTLNEPQGYYSFKKDIFDTDTYECQLDRMFGIWNSTLWEKSN